MADPNNVKSIFLAASEKLAAERAAYLDEAAGGDTAFASVSKPCSRPTITPTVF